MIQKHTKILYTTICEGSLEKTLTTDNIDIAFSDDNTIKGKNCSQN